MLVIEGEKTPAYLSGISSKLKSLDGNVKNMNGLKGNQQELKVEAICG